MNRRHLLATGSSILGIALLAGNRLALPARAAQSASFPVMKTDAEWQKLLTPVQFDILRRQGTEYPGTSPLDHEFRPGRYDCVGCGQHLYLSTTKFDSGTGWPSFWAPIDHAVDETVDHSSFMTRTEVHCANCGGHLGHVFDDGPKPTGLRYCMNGAVLVFHPTTA
jgi:peptide-methionine (R)-S-oxide reductase